jgi:hypothetical protein
MLFANNLNFPIFKHRDTMNLIQSNPPVRLFAKSTKKPRNSNKLNNISFPTRFETSQNITNQELKEISFHYSNEKEHPSKKNTKPKIFAQNYLKIKQDLSQFRNFLAKL